MCWSWLVLARKSHLLNFLEFCEAVLSVQSLLTIKLHKLKNETKVMHRAQSFLNYFTIIYALEVIYIYCMVEIFIILCYCTSLLISVSSDIMLVG